MAGILPFVTEKCPKSFVCHRVLCRRAKNAVFSALSFFFLGSMTGILPLVTGTYPLSFALHRALWRRLCKPRFFFLFLPYPRFYYQA